ncbi:MAG: hypothetical protein LBR20_08620 [Propionibacteriaceae bacterium]|jgi:hypothetical protein|nr:hypothetical protein [Propionibacteriaceae bacterium]
MAEIELRVTDRELAVINAALGLLEDDAEAEVEDSPKARKVLRLTREVRAKVVEVLPPTTNAVNINWYD